MPYIKPLRRPFLDAPIDSLGMRIRDVGELNYCITRLVLQFFRHVGLNYANIAGVVGTLKLVSTELERRVINPYEDMKIAENGDVEEYHDGV